MAEDADDVHDDSHQYITMGRFHRNDADADRLVMDFVRRSGTGLSKSRLRKSTFTFDFGKGPFKRTFAEMKREARETGTVSTINSIRASSDPFFGPSIDIATNAGMKVKSSYAGHEREFTGPMRVALIENELCHDILYFRAAACEASASTSFRRCTMYYRAYVLTCASLVEAFLNRPVLLATHLREHVEAIKSLHRPMNFEDRIALWVETFCVEPTATLKSTTAWAHLQELRAERNRLVHALEPQLGVEIRSLERGLNLAREGVGGLMRTLRRMQGLGPTGFIERTESAPRVVFGHQPGRRRT